MPKYINGELSMNNDNSLIVNEKGEIVHIGEGMLAYVDLTGKFPFAYPSDLLRKDDVILFISKNFNNSEASLFGKAGISINISEKCVLFLGVYENEEIQPIEKYGKELFQGVGFTMLDTFFYKNDVKAIWNNDKSLLCISINHQYLECQLVDHFDQLIIIRGNEICYFRNDSCESRKDGNKTILSGKPFSSYMNMQHISKLKLFEIFPDNILKQIEELDESGQKTFDYKGIVTMMQTSKLTLGEYVYFYYTIIGEENILDNIRKDSLVYNKLQSFKNDNTNCNLSPSTFEFLGKDNHLAEIKILLQKACNTNVSILLTGESGTGKTFLAKEIHRNSRKNQNNFIHVNCAAIPYQLIESELFGYEDGAFTGAKKGGRKGYFEQANNGTIFLDEIAEIPMTLQGKLLEVIQNRTFYRVGGSEKININARLIFATNHDLREMVLSSKFREDLYYRINVFPVQLQPLRERKEVIFNIMMDIMPRICQNLEIEPLLIDSGALDKIREYDWPGNIRELENLLERAAILSNGKIITAKDIKLPEPLVPTPGFITLKEQTDCCEKKAILAALNKYNGDKEKVAQILDIGRTNLYNKINKYNIKYLLNWGENNDSE